MLRKRIAGGALVLAALLGAATLAGTPSDAAAGPPKVSNAWNRPANNDEVGLMVLANQERAAAGVLPLLWDDGLATAARVHSTDMAENKCFQHNSCNGFLWYKRVEQYFPGWSSLAENIGSGTTDPRYLHSGWMHSDGHRANIMSGANNKFGAGIIVGQDGFGDLPLGTEDFGNQALISLNAYPMIPGATVLQDDPGKPNEREMRANFFKYPYVAPTSVEAIVGTKRYTLTMLAGGKVGNATYGNAKHTFNSCQPVYFEAKAAGLTYRYPTAGTLLIGPETVDCGGSNPPGTTTTSTAATTTTTTAKPTTTTTSTPKPPTGAPVVVIDNPAPGGVTGNVEIRAHATDPDGVVQMEVYVNDKRLVRVGTDSVKRKWEANRYPSGTYTIEVKAKDSKGTVGSTSITVTK